MSNTWRERLAAGRVLLMDGGTGSELRRRGFELDARAWSAPAALTDFELLRSIQSDYIAAGALQAQASSAKPRRRSSLPVPPSTSSTPPAASLSRHVPLIWPC